MKTILIAAFALAALAFGAKPALAANVTAMHCLGQIGTTANPTTVNCNLSMTASVSVYQLDNSQNSTTTWFQLFHAAPTLGTTAPDVEIAVPPGAAEVISLPSLLIDSFANIVVGCTQAPQGQTNGGTTAMAGCTFEIWFQ